MKRCVVSIAILLVVALVAGTVLAEKKKGKGKAEQPILVQPGVKKVPEKLERKRRMSSEEARAERKRDQEEMYRGMAHKEQLRKTNEQIEKRRGEHEKFVGELNAVKKLALEEKAEKTANRIQQLIDKSTGRFKEDIRKLEQKRDRTREQMEKQAEQHMRRRERLMERKEQQREKGKAEEKVGKGKGKTEEKADRGKGKGKGRGKGKSEDENEAEGRKSW